MHQEWLIRGKKIIMTILLNKIIVNKFHGKNSIAVQPIPVYSVSTHAV